MKKIKSKYLDRVKDLETIKEVFDKFGVPFYIVYGAVLGLHRDGDFIEHDDDIDLAVCWGREDNTGKENNLHKCVDFETRKKIGWALYDLGFQPQPICFNVFGRMEPSEIGYNGGENSGIIVCERNYKFTIFFFEPHTCTYHNCQELICYPKLGSLPLIATPTGFFVEKKAEKVKINGKEYLLPSPIDKYLEIHYKDWRDRQGREHSPTYFEAHPEDAAMLNLEGKNNAMILK